MARTIIPNSELIKYFNQTSSIDFASMLNEDMSENYTLFIMWNEVIKRRWCCNENGDYFWRYEIPCFLRHHSNNSEKDRFVSLDINCDNDEWDFSSAKMFVDDGIGKWSEGYKVELI